MEKLEEEWELKRKEGSERKLIKITEREIPDIPSKVHPHKAGT